MSQTITIEDAKNLPAGVNCRFYQFNSETEMRAWLVGEVNSGAVYWDAKAHILFVPVGDGKK